MNQEQVRAWAEAAAAKLQHKMKPVAERNLNVIPYRSENKRFEDMSEKDVCWWTNGFWGGMMWQLYHAFGDDCYRAAALENERKLDANLMNWKGMDHDSGFKWLPTSVAHYRQTKDPASFNRGMLAASDLAGRFNPTGRFIRAWNDTGDGEKAGWAIIDCMMNLPLLYWAAKETNDPRFKHIAIMHADTAQEHFIRQDGSSKHIISFDPESGDYLRSYGGQGYERGSSWTRGQAWALYGFVLSYIHTGRADYLATARKVADYFIGDIPDHGRIPVDFRQPADCQLEDSTAAAIAACGLLEIQKQLPPEAGAGYGDAAVKMLMALDNERCNWDADCDYLLERCTAAFHDKEHEFTIIYGDYFFIEAILKITEQELFIW